MRQRVGLARALAVDADILLMDEPFASVDEQIRRTFQEDLLRLLAEERKTVLFVTHSIEEAVYVSDQIVILTRGPGRVTNTVRPQIPRDGTSDEIRRSQPYLDAVEEIWGELRAYAEEDMRAPTGGGAMTIAGRRMPMALSLLRLVRALGDRRAASSWSSSSRRSPTSSPPSARW